MTATVIEPKSYNSFRSRYIELLIIAVIVWNQSSLQERFEIQILACKTALVSAGDLRYIFMPLFNYVCVC